MTLGGLVAPAISITLRSRRAIAVKESHRRVGVHEDGCERNSDPARAAASAAPPRPRAPALPRCPPRVTVDPPRHTTSRTHPQQLLTIGASHG